MSKTISQQVVFRNATTNTLYDLYMNARLHSMIAGGPVKITPKAGAKFSAFGDSIRGKNLHLVKNRQIVQTWRGEEWSKKEPDSIFMISLEQMGKDVVLNMVHGFLPDKEMAGIKKGWFDYYWNPWKQYIAGKTITRPGM
jgi:activator of HSP90 ATPase